MLPPPDALLIVEKGAPYRDGEPLPLSGEKLLSEQGVLLGRTWQDQRPDIAFTSPFVSRRHAIIRYVDQIYLLTDLPGSRHGTRINDEAVAPGIPWEVMDGDCIRLAGEEVVLAFSTTASVGETWDFPASRSKDILIVKADRREVLLDGKLLDLSGKPYNLLCVLYGRRGRVVSYSDIKKAVWPECALSDKGEPLVTDEDLTTQVYRLRKSLDPHSHLIQNKPGYGYMLDLPR